MKFLNLFVSQFREFYRTKIYIYQYAESTFDETRKTLEFLEIEDLSPEIITAERFI